MPSRFALLLEELVRHLDQDAGAVAGQRIAAAGAAMHEVQEDLDALADDVVRRDALDVGDEADATRVVLELRIVESGPAREAHRLELTEKVSAPEVGDRSCRRPKGAADSGMGAGLYGAHPTWSDLQ